MNIPSLMNFLTESFDDIPGQVGRAPNIYQPLPKASKEIQQRAIKEAAEKRLRKKNRNLRNMK